MRITNRLQRTARIASAMFFAAFCSPSVYCQSMPVNGLQIVLSVDSQQAAAKIPTFRVEFRNVAENDLILNIGWMLANGRKQYSHAVILYITDSTGVRRRFDLIGPPGVAGRVDPFVVPLPVGATFSIPLQLDKYWPAASKEWNYKFGPGKYAIAVGFLGKGVTDQQANLDSKYVALFPYWEGTLQSNELQFELRAK